ncbi:Protein of unknown function [Neorhodopirellula lusitana]|uniref:DUF1501 domain-containing protein n=1 Tax=Neorhodopirellula lusitana TaxID=445327 RepID=A0ABY1QS04_9BACT|nr:DUF1501 domain-containing protein [Neorhodopirellula lusitana]SMP76045.1 Protein of unknown function [Neorhodopirellula lusitana]
MATLIVDLEQTRLLGKTLIVITTEFGRPSGFDSGGGREHQDNSFSCVLAGGGLSNCGAYVQTDQQAKRIEADPVCDPDFYATICAATGVD